MYTGRTIEELMDLVDKVGVPREAELRAQAELEFIFCPMGEIEAEQVAYETELAGVA